MSGRRVRGSDGQVVRFHSVAQAIGDVSRLVDGTVSLQVAEFAGFVAVGILLGRVSSVVVLLDTLSTQR